MKRTLRWQKISGLRHFSLFLLALVTLALIQSCNIQEQQNQTTFEQAQEVYIAPYEDQEQTAEETLSLAQEVAAAAPIDKATDVSLEKTSNTPDQQGFSFTAIRNSLSNFFLVELGDRFRSLWGAEEEEEFLLANLYAIAAEGDINDRSNNESGPVTNAIGAPDGNSTEIGASNDYIVLTLADELPIGTDYTIYIGGRNNTSVTAEVWEAPDGTTLPGSQQSSPTGFTQNGTASSSGAITTVTKTAAVATKFIYLQRGSGDIVIDAVEYCLATCAPTNVTASATQATCTGTPPTATANMDASIVLNTVTDGDRYLIVQGTSFGSMTVADATLLSTLGGSAPYTLLSGLANPASNVTYTIRVFNGNDDNCATDVSVTLRTTDCNAICECTEYLYVNDVDEDVTHKFAIDPVTGGVTEIGSPWLDNDTQVSNQHGIAQDINGRIYIGDSFRNGPINRLDAFGNVLDDNAFSAEDPSIVSNIIVEDNILYAIREREPFIYAYDVCTGDPIGKIGVAQPAPSEEDWWGIFTANDGMWYVASRESTPRIYSGPLDISLYSDVTMPAANFGTELFQTVTSPGVGALGDETNLMGLTRDIDGNFYIVENQTGRGLQPDLIVVKYDPNGNFIRQLQADNTRVANLIDGQPGFSGARGIAYSEMSNKIYLGSFDNCVTVLDTNLVELSALNIGNPLGGSPKGIGIIKECCPTGDLNLSNSICYDGSQDETVFLQNLLECEGIITEGTWAETSDPGNIADFDMCSLQVTISDSGCATYTLSADGTGNNNQCGMFTITLEICAGPPPTSDTPTTAQGTCNGATPNDDATITIPNIMNADVVGISSAGATSYDGSVYDATAAPADLQLVPGSNEVIFSGLQHSTIYAIRLFNQGSGCSEDILVTTPIPPEACFSPVSCNCKEYIYLNEPQIGSVLKFEVNTEPNFPLTEVVGVNGGTPPNEHWYPGTNTTELPAPHGIAADLNGNLYIGDVGVDAKIRRLTCDGELLDTSADPAVTNTGPNQNIFSIDNTLYVNTDEGPTAYDLCTGNVIGQVCLNNVPSGGSGRSSNLWGLSYNPVTEMVYVTSRLFTSHIWVFTRAELEASVADASGNTCIDPLISESATVDVDNISVGDQFLPAHEAGYFGIVGDNVGNFYVVQSTLDSDQATTTTPQNRILKYNSSGAFQAASIEGSNAADANLLNNFWFTAGITWSEETNYLFIANLTDVAPIDCITAFDAATMTSLGTAVPNPNLPVNNQAKAIGILKECCPENLPNAFERTIACAPPGETFFLNEEAFATCDGVVCGSSWDVVALNGATFEPCNNSVTVTGTGCSVFSLDLSAVVSTNCPAQGTTFTICFEDESTTFDTPTSAQGTCNGTTPNDDATISIANIMNADVVGVSSADATEYDGSPYDPTATASDLFLVSAGAATLTGLEHGADYIVRLFNQSSGCSTDVMVTTAMIDCTVQLLGAIGNYVWIDENSDGLQDAGEPGIPNVEMILKDMSGTEIDRTITASDGSYLFPDLPEAMYFVMVDENTLPAGMTQTTIYTEVLDGDDADTDLDDGDYGNKDNTANSGNGYKITLDAGEENLSADFGYNYNPTNDVNMPSGSPLAALGDRVWYDADRDGVQDPEEVGVEGVKLKLITDLNIVSGGLDLNGDGVVDSEDDGMVVADDGTTMLTVTDGAIVGATIETVGGFNIVGGALDTDGSGSIDAGDTDRVADITIDMATTDANGYYLFDGLFPGAYNVMVADDANGTGTGGPLEGFMQTGDPDHFAVSEGDNPDDSVEDDNMTSKPVVLGPGDVFLNVDFGYDNDTALGAIGDYVWLDADADGNGPNAAGGDPASTVSNQGAGGEDDSAETPIEGVTVALIKDTNGDGKWDVGEPIIASDITDEDGLYFFPGLPTGTDADYLVVVTDTENVLDGLKPTYDADGGTMEVDIFPASQMSNMELGISSVTDLVAEVGNEVLTQDFGYTPEAQDAGEGLIGDYVWFDTNSDGNQDDDESGIEGVKVDLFDLGDDNAVGGTGANEDTYIGSTVTDENGYYYFGGLAVDMDGEGYQVKIAESGSPSGMDNFAAGMALEGLANTTDPDNGTTDPDDNMGGAVLLDNDNPVNLMQDFGYVGDPGGTVGSIGNKIFNDVNANGVRDAGEMGFNGVTVDLYRDLNGNGQLDPGEPRVGSTVTENMMSDDGMYLFENLPLDDYIVNVTDVDGILTGYWHSSGNQDASSGAAGGIADDASGGTSGDNSKDDIFAVTIDTDVPNNLNVDFGYYKDPAAVGNYVWNDLDGDGQQDETEPGIAGVEVSMMITYPDATMITLFAETDSDGFYEFPNLLIDEDYRTGAGTGTNGEDPSGVTEGMVTPKYVIKVDDTQAALSAFMRTLEDETTGGITDEDDSDDFDGVVAIPVQGDQDTDLFKTDGTLATANDEEIEASYDFGVKEVILGAIGNYVWLDENSDGFQDEGERGIPNVAVILKDGSGTSLDTTYTDSDGKYLFPDLPAGDYFVDVVDATIPNGMTQTITFTNEVDGSDADTVNDDGDLGNKNHSGNGYAITLDLGEENLTADFGYNYNPTDDVNNGINTAALGDRVWIDSDGDGVQDPNEVGVSGVTITLIIPGADGIFGTADDDTSVTTTTDENGYYIFDGLAPGAYQTEVTGDGGASHSILTPTQYEQTGDPDHFGTSEADNPDDTVEDDNKQTKAIVLGPGDVYLNSDYGYQPIDGQAPVGSIGNTVWLDADADGNGPTDSDPDSDGANGVGMVGDADANEQPVAGVSVTLIDDVDGDGVWEPAGADGMLDTADDEQIVATDVTDENGQYLFEGLPLDKNGTDSDYIVWVNDTDNVLDGLRPTYDGDDMILNTTDPEATGAGDDADMVLGMSDVTISSGTPDDRNQDFGYTPVGNDAGEGFIGDFVWFDTNESGTSTPDAGETGIEGVLMELLDVNGNVIATTTTDENGFYLFGGLPLDDGTGDPGADYTVRVASSNFNAMAVLEGLETTFEPGGGDQNDNQGAVVTLTMVAPGDLDQDFSYVTSSNNVGSIGSTIWEDTDNDGLYEPFGTNGVDDGGAGDDETPLAGVTVNLIRDLNGNGQIDPGEPIFGSDVTDANGDYLFSNLPLDEYIVDVTDEDGILAGYFSSPVPTTDATTNAGAVTADDKTVGSNGGGDRSKPDAFAIAIDEIILNNFNVDFGYYKEPAAVGNYVWLDTDEDGQQDAGESGIENVIVQMMITYPDGTMITLGTLTDADGFYEFPNLLLDEDYRIGIGEDTDMSTLEGTGVNGADPSTLDPDDTQTPLYVIKVDETQTAITTAGLIPTLIDQTTGGITDKDDADDNEGVVAIPVQGNEDTDLFKTDGTLSTANDETVEASYDFGFRMSVNDLATTIVVDPDAGFYDVGDPATFKITVFNQGDNPASDIDITNYVPTALTPPTDQTFAGAAMVMLNGGGTANFDVVKVGDVYTIDFGDTSTDWLQAGENVMFSITYTVNAGDAVDNTNDGIVNIVEISAFDNDNVPSNTAPTDIDSTPDGTDDDNFGENPRDNSNDNVIDEDAVTNPTTDDEDDHDFAEITANVVLPVELLSFKAQADKDHVDLTWSTATETNNSHFELERSEDGKTFKPIARIQGQGTTLEPTDYKQEDYEAIPNVLYYYRLKQVDLDGVFEYSEIRTAQLEEVIGDIDLYPNPIGLDQALQVRFYAKEAVADFVIMDMNSRPVLRVKQDLNKIGWTTIQIELDGLAAGNYLLMDKAGNTKSFIVVAE